jgi:crossover junction endodeoxyribonuclease RuvC
MKCIGLDMSWTGTGIVCGSCHQDITVRTVKTKPADFPNDYARIRHIVDTTMQCVQGCDLVAIEDYFTPHSGAQMGAAIKLVQLGTMIRFALYDSKISTIICAPSQIKKFATGKGNAPKSMMMMKVSEKWGFSAKDDNQADAYTLWRIAKAFSGDDPMLKYEADVCGNLKDQNRDSAIFRGST